MTIFNRGRQPQDWPGHVEELLGDRNTGDLKALEGREWDVCIDNPTTLPFWVRDAGQVLKGKVKHYIFISTISVYAANDKPADETAALAAYKGADPMAETQAAVGQHRPLRPAEGGQRGRGAAGSSARARRPSIRPGLIVGPGDETDRFTYWPVRANRRPRRRGAGARRRERSGAVHRRPRPGRMDRAHGRDGARRRVQRHRARPRR